MSDASEQIKSTCFNCLIMSLTTFKKDLRIDKVNYSHMNYKCLPEFCIIFPSGTIKTYISSFHSLSAASFKQLIH